MFKCRHLFVTNDLRSSNESKHLRKILNLKMLVFYFGDTFPVELPIPHNIFVKKQTVSSVSPSMDRWLGTTDLNLSDF